MAASTQSYREEVSAVTAGVVDLRRIISEAQERQGMFQQSTVLFVDEIHRFNKAQQDVILPHVENGTFTLIGATTENPSFEVIAPLLSRCRVFKLESLGYDDLEAVINKALTDSDRGLGLLQVSLESEALEILINMSNGDARIALNVLEMATVALPSDHAFVLTSDTIVDAMQCSTPFYDKSGDAHYDTISAFIKSIRGSSPDGALYWLAKMINAGEDPLFIARRLVISASEDIGMARPEALSVAMAAQQAVHFLGMPEARIPLAEATVYLSAAPKSNSAYLGLESALSDVRDRPNEPVPLHLRNAATDLMSDMDYGKGYKYDHGYEGHFSGQQYLPPSVQGQRYYIPTNEGDESIVKDRLTNLWGENS
tara:strand:+ start:241 stop:1347 length:1107 start_codon:yes stop_codon:yes gene_type:complete